MPKRLCATLILAFTASFSAHDATLAKEPGLLFAHRGGAREFEENTLSAFQGSYEKGVRGFETDVRMTSDGALVILHDDDLKRMYNAVGPVERRTTDELRTIVTKKGGEPMLFLDKLLAYFADKPGIYLELEMKTSNKDLYPDERLDEYCRKLLAAVQAHRAKDSLYVFTSFDERPLRTVEALDKKAERLLITDGPCSPEIVNRAKELGIHRIGVHIDETSRAAVQAAQKAGMRVSCWPGHDLQDYQLAVGLGVDAICSDVPVTIQIWKKSCERQYAQ
jgi:glycerophosphoryl diester phosphodiesterase